MTADNETENNNNDAPQTPDEQAAASAEPINGNHNTNGTNHNTNGTNHNNDKNKTNNNSNGNKSSSSSNNKSTPPPPLLSEIPFFTIPPGVQRVLHQHNIAETRPYANDSEYADAVVACESARLATHLLRSRLAASVFAVYSKHFASKNHDNVARGLQLLSLMEALSQKLDGMREARILLAANPSATTDNHKNAEEGTTNKDETSSPTTTTTTTSCLPTLEVFLNKMEATREERQIFYLVFACSSGMIERYGYWTANSSSSSSNSVEIIYGSSAGRGGSYTVTLARIREVLPHHGLSLQQLMNLASAQSKWVKNKVFLRASSPNSQLLAFSNDATAALMGVELSLAQYQALECPVLSETLREHPWFQATATGKAVLQQRQREALEESMKNKQSSSNDDAPSLLVEALQTTSKCSSSSSNKNNNKSTTTSAPARDRVFKAMSSVAAATKNKQKKEMPSSSDTPEEKEKSTETTTTTDEKSITTMTTSKRTEAADEFGPYPSELSYLEDQIRLMKMEMALNKVCKAMDNAVLEDEEEFQRYSCEELLAHFKGRIKNKDEYLLENEHKCDKILTKLKKLQAKVATKLAATQAQTSHKPRLEQLCEALHLEKLEKYIIVDLVMGLIMPSSRMGSRGEVGAFVEQFSVTLEDKMQCRKFFYKTSTLIKEGIVTISEQDFMTDLTQAHLSLDRRMFDFIVGLDTEFSELLDGSHLYIPKVSLDNVVLNNEMKKRVCDCIASFDKVREEYDRLEVKDKISYGLGQVLLFYGQSGTGKTMLANAIAAKLQKKVLLVNFPSLGLNSSGALIKFLFREARINNALLFFDECESLFRTRDHGMSSVNMILTELEHFDDLCILATNRPAELDEAMYRRITLALEFKKPDHIMREMVWKQLHPPKLALAEDVDFGELARKFTLTGGLIKNAWLQALGLKVQRGGEEVTQEDLVQAASEQVIGTLTLEEFDLRVVPTQGIDAVVVSDELRESLSNIVQFTKAQSVLFGQWGFEKLHRAETGISALFCGPPGTGKSMAAEAIGYDLGRPLKVANTAALVSKWVGETGKHIESIFADAKKKNAVLVFDEAEGLFGKRGGGGNETSTSRHDTMNVGLLLQHIEQFEGVCIVVTNMRDAIDSAFFRRFHFVLEFERPSPSLRKKLWESVVPKECPMGDDVSFDDLARHYDLCGGNIKSALFRAATRAALRERAEDRVIGMKDLEAACSEEIKKAGANWNSAMYS